MERGAERRLGKRKLPRRCDFNLQARIGPLSLVAAITFFALPKSHFTVSDSHVKESERKVEREKEAGSERIARVHASPRRGPRGFFFISRDAVNERRATRRVTRRQKGGEYTKWRIVLRPLSLFPLSPPRRPHRRLRFPAAALIL